MKKLALNIGQRKALKPYERHLLTAYRSQFVTGLPVRGAHTIFDIYNDVYNAHETGYSCPACCLMVCERLGRLYFGENKEVKDDK